MLIRKVSEKELPADALRAFNRYQETRRVRYLSADGYAYKPNHFIEQWDEGKKRGVVQSLHNCLHREGVVAAAFSGGEIIAFAAVEAGLFGCHKEYLELSYLHVSYECRRRGIGKALFQFCCARAKEMGAAKLYISAHPAEETQLFYLGLGCVLAAEVNRDILAREPLDLQLEFVI